MNSTRLLMVLFIVYGTRRVDGTLPPFLKTLVSKHLQKHFAPDAGCDEIEHHDDGEVAHVVAEPIVVDHDDGGDNGNGGDDGNGRDGTEPIWIEYDEHGDVVSVTANEWRTAADAEKPIVIEVDERGNVVNVNAGHGHGWSAETGGRTVHDGGNVVNKLKNGGGLFLSMLKDEIRDKMNAIKSKWPFGKESATEQPADLVYDGRTAIDLAAAAPPVPPVRNAVYHYYTYYTPYQHQQPYYYGYVPQQHQHQQQQQQQWNRYSGLGPYPSSPVAYPSSPVAYPRSPVSYPSSQAAYPSSPAAYPKSPMAYPSNPIAYPTGPAAYPGNSAAQPIVVYSTVADASSPSVQQPQNRADATADDDWNAHVANDVGNADYPSRGDVPFGGRRPEDDTAKERRHVVTAADPSTTAVPQAVAMSEQPTTPPPVADAAQSARL